jgi:hypothetical protein
LLDHIDHLATELQKRYPSQVQALHRVVAPTTHQPAVAKPQRPLRYLKFGGSQVPVYPKDLLPRPLLPIFHTPIRELKLKSGRVLRQKGSPVFQGWRGDRRWWNAPDARPAEAVEFLQGLVALREILFEENQPTESPHFPLEETATVQTRGYALYRDPRTQQDWFKAEAFAW